MRRYPAAGGRYYVPRPAHRQCAWCPRRVKSQGYARHVMTHYCEAHGRFHTQGGFQSLHGALVRVFGTRQARPV